MYLLTHWSGAYYELEIHSLAVSDSKEELINYCRSLATGFPIRCEDKFNVDETDEFYSIDAILFLPSLNKTKK